MQFPRSRDISLPLLDETVKPSLAVRGFWCGLPAERRKNKSLNDDMEQWQARNRYLPYSSVIPSAGDGSIMTPLHKWETREVDGEKMRVNTLFEEHPEYFALNKDGSRNEDYLDVTNPEVLEVATQYAFNYFKKHPDSIAFPIAPPDGAPTSEDPASQALNRFFMQREPADPKIQDISGSFYWFMNELAKRVKQEYPDKLLTTTAYSGRIRPPENLKLSDNITIHTALLPYSRHHRYDSPTWQTQDRVQLYKRWTALLDKVVERPYYPCFQFTCNVPQQLYRTSAYNIRFIQDIRMIGKEWEGRTSFFSEGATDYIRGQLMWNTETDVGALLDDYYMRLFGKAAPTVRRFDEDMETALTQCLIDHMEEERIHEIYPHDFAVPVTDQVGDLAKLVADADAINQESVKYFRNVVDHFRDYSEMRYAESQLDFILAAQKAQSMIDIENELNKINLTFIDATAQKRDSSPTYGELGANASAYGKLKEYAAKQKMMDGTDGRLRQNFPKPGNLKPIHITTASFFNGTSSH